jgi:hypothetical protein
MWQKKPGSEIEYLWYHIRELTNESGWLSPRLLQGVFMTVVSLPR